MFKKALVALALGGAFVASASAADVTVYGKVDYGFIYNHTSKSAVKAYEDTTSDNTFKLQSGVNSASRLGFKGTEDLGNGFKVGFKLENGFKSDDGSFKTENRLFDREASLSLYSDFGTLSFGRMGGVGSGAGTYDLVFATGDAFDGGDNDVFGFTKSSRYDNMVAYQSPEFAGFKATAMYSFKNDATSKDDTGTEGKSEANRYAGVALNAKLGAFEAVFAYEAQLYGDKQYGNVDDGNTFYLGGNFDAGFAKFFAMGEYFQHVRSVGAFENKDVFDVNNKYFKGSNGFEGYSLHLGAQVPVFAGTFTVGGYYSDGSIENFANYGKEDVDFDYYGVAARYEYPLSTRTTIYCGAGYGQATVDKWGNHKDDYENKITQVYTGLVHAF